MNKLMPDSMSDLMPDSFHFFWSITPLEFRHWIKVSTDENEALEVDLQSLQCNTV